MVIDIDEKSLNSLGQWPWPRVLLSKLLYKVNSYNPSAISFDILFPEKDRTSPQEFLSFYQNILQMPARIEGVPKGLLDNDTIFAKALEKSSSTIGLYLSNGDSTTQQCEPRSLKGIELEGLEPIRYKNIVCNTEQLSSQKIATGSINTNIDSDGVLRRLPLFFAHEDKLIPTLSVATLLNIDNDFKRSGARSFEILNHSVKTDKNANLLIRFYRPSWYKKISALDLLSGRVKKELLQGKIALIASSATSLHDQLIVTGGKKLIGAHVHVSMIDNMLHGDYLTEPEYFKILNTLLSLVLSFVLFFLLLRKKKYLAFSLLIFTSLLLWGLSYLAFVNNIYVSVAYFALPFILNIFLISIIYSIIDIYDKHLFEKELTRKHIAQLDQKIVEKTADLVHSHKHIADNINYASLIQNAILPDEHIVQKYANGHFVFWQPKDTVGGDIYLFTELQSQKEIIIMVIDGSGHGVTGAFVTMLVKAIETQIIGEINSKTLSPDPALILEHFNKSLKSMLKQTGDSKSNAGFDGGVLYFNKESGKCTYAGAKTPLYIVDDGKISIIKSDRKNVGFKRTKFDQSYTNHEITLQKNTKLYLTTDGIIDQDYEDGRSFGRKGFENLIEKINHDTFKRQKNVIIDLVKKLLDNSEQRDDITIFAVEFRFEEK